MTQIQRQPDALGEILHLVRMSGTFYCRTELTAPWGLELPPRQNCVSFHVVTAGSCWLETGDGRQLLQAGDLALVPHGKGHRLLSDPSVQPARIDELNHEYVSDRYAILRYGGGGAPSTLICGAARFDHPASRYLVALLPDVIFLSAGGFDQVGWLSTTLRFMAAEARELHPGGETVITRLADILVIQAIRYWIEHGPVGGSQLAPRRSDRLRQRDFRQVGRALRHRLKRLAVKLRRTHHPEAVDRISEQNNLDPARPETFELRRGFQPGAIVSGHVEDRLLPFLHRRDIVGEAAQPLARTGRTEPGEVQSCSRRSKSS